MGMQINTNVSALNAYRNLSSSQNDLSKSLEKLSSGFRINRAADDAAGLAISEGLRSQIGGYKVAARNAQDGVSLVQTAEGALTEVHSILQRMRDLAVQAGNDSNNTESRAAISTEANELQKELTRIAETTNFNGIQLLDGSSPTLTFQVGAGSGASNQIAVDLAGADVSAVADNLVAGLNTSTIVANAATTAGNWVFTQGGVEVTVAMGAVDATRTVGDIASTLNADAGFAASFEASVNTDGELQVTSKLSNTNVTIAGTGYTSHTDADGDLAFATAAGAQAAILAIDSQIETISTARAKLGAYQNRFESAIRSINVSVENLSASESRIRDTDMASEMVSFTRSQILQQAGTAMLAQANQVPQGVLQLLR
jgi:flagellin